MGGLRDPPGRGSGAATDGGGGGGPPAAVAGVLLNVRFLMPVLPLLVLSAVASLSAAGGGGVDGAATAATAASASAWPLFGAAAATPPRAQVLAALAGFLTYKAPLVWRTGGELLAAAAYDDGRPDTSLSMTGRLVKAAARGVLRSSSSDAAAGGNAATAVDGAAPTTEIGRAHV